MDMMTSGFALAEFLHPHVSELIELHQTNQIEAPSGPLS